MCDVYGLWHTLLLLAAAAYAAAATAVAACYCCCRVPLVVWAQGEQGVSQPCCFPTPSQSHLYMFMWPGHAWSVGLHPQPPSHTLIHTPLTLLLCCLQQQQYIGRDLETIIIICQKQPPLSFILPSPFPLHPPLVPPPPPPFPPRCECCCCVSVRPVQVVLHAGGSACW